MYSMWGAKNRLTVCRIEHRLIVNFVTNLLVLKMSLILVCMADICELDSWRPDAVWLVEIIYIEKPWAA